MLAPKTYRKLLLANGFQALPKDDDPYGRQARVEHPQNSKIVLHALFSDLTGPQTTGTRLSLFTTFGTSPLFGEDPLNIVISIDVNDEALANAILAATVDRFNVLPVGAN